MGVSGILRREWAVGDIDPEPLKRLKSAQSSSA